MECLRLSQTGPGLPDRYRLANDIAFTRRPLQISQEGSECRRARIDTATPLGIEVPPTLRARRAAWTRNHAGLDRV